MMEQNHLQEELDQFEQDCRLFEQLKADAARNMPYLQFLPPVETLELVPYPSNGGEYRSS